MIGQITCGKRSERCSLLVLYTLACLNPCVHYLERHISHSFGQVISLQAVPVVEVLPYKHRHLQRNCGSRGRDKITWTRTTTRRAKVSFWRQLTGQDGGHEGSKHQEQHGEKEEASVVEDLTGIIPNFQIEQTNQHPNTQVGHHPEVGQHLGNSNDKDIININVGSRKAKDKQHGSICSLFTVSLHIVMKVLLKRMQNCVNVLVAKLCFSRVPVSCGGDQWKQQLYHETGLLTFIDTFKNGIDAYAPIMCVIQRQKPGRGSKRLEAEACPCGV